MSDRGEGIGGSGGQDFSDKISKLNRDIQKVRENIKQIEPVLAERTKALKQYQKMMDTHSYEGDIDSKFYEYFVDLESKLEYYKQLMNNPNATDEQKNEARMAIQQLLKQKEQLEERVKEEKEKQKAQLKAAIDQLAQQVKQYQTQLSQLQANEKAMKAQKNAMKAAMMAQAGAAAKKRNMQANAPAAEQGKVAG